MNYSSKLLRKQFEFISPVLGQNDK